MKILIIENVLLIFIMKEICHIIIIKSKNPLKINLDKGLYFNQFEREFFYHGECDNKENNCLDEMLYSNKYPNVYSNKNAVSFMINRFNKDFSKNLEL